MTTGAAPTPPSTPTSDARPADLILLVELAEVCCNLRRLRRDSASTNADLRQRRSRVIHLDALLRADSIARARLRESDTADRVAVEILDDAVAGARTIVRGSTAHRCPRCRRILVPAPASQLASAG